MATLTQHVTIITALLTVVGETVLFHKASPAMNAKYRQHWPFTYVEALQGYKAQ